MKKFIGVYNKSVILTYFGLFFSLFGIYQLMIINPEESINRFNIAIICMILAGICDLFDGKIARMCKRNEQEKQFGIQIDSLVDVVSFLVFPTIFLITIATQLSNYTLDAFIIGSIFVLCGIIRLAWFNITTDGNTTYYTGLPVTFISIIIPLFYTFLYNLLPNLIFNFLLQIIYLIIAFLFILKIKIKKPTGKWYIIFSIIAIITIIFLII